MRVAPRLGRFGEEPVEGAANRAPKHPEDAFQKDDCEMIRGCEKDANVSESGRRTLSGGPFALTRTQLPHSTPRKRLSRAALHGPL
jgi:hypothetical protein